MTDQLTAMTALTETEQSRLQHEEAAIEHGAQQVGTALATIRDQRLYRGTHVTFASYCQQRWGISNRHANRQIMAAEIAGKLGPIGPTLTESQARELAPLRDQPQQMRETWQRANDATGGQPTAAAIREAREPAPSWVEPDTGEILDAEIVDEPAPAPAQRRASRQPLPKFANDTAWGLRKSVERAQRVIDDDRYTHNADQVANAMRGHLTYTVETCQRLLDRINNQQQEG